MNRRNLLFTLGATGGGLAVGDCPLIADVHEADSARQSPVAGPFAHLCGIHVAKCNPRFQIVAQHYCADHRNHGKDEGLFQCLLFDSPRHGAKLLGVEYIISDKQYRGLRDEEKKYWHPHTYEVLAGGLILPGMSPEDEMPHLRDILHTWGKSWHTWPDPATDIPLGEPLLMWSLTGDGQVDERVVAERDREFNVSIKALRAVRGREFGLEVPQVSFPASEDHIGRQWCDEGPDRPVRRSP
jgi:hypothetical protein